MGNCPMNNKIEMCFSQIGPDANYQKLFEKSGSMVSAIVKSSGSVVYVQFSSDAIVNGWGVEVGYQLGRSPFAPGT